MSFDRDAAGVFLRRLREARTFASGGPEVGWEITEAINYSWCDQDDQAPSAAQWPGFVLLLARKSIVRIIISHTSPWSDYNFTLPIAAVDRLIDLVRAVLND